MTIASIVIGGLITAFGWYTPFMWFGAAAFTVGAGLLKTLQVDSSAGKWIGYQILAGIGAGGGVQIPFIAVQVVLSAKDMPTGSTLRIPPILSPSPLIVKTGRFSSSHLLNVPTDAIVIFFNSLGGAISISIAQNIFVNTLVAQIPKYTTGIDPALIVAAGATHIREVTPPSQLAGVLMAYDVAVQRAFVLPIAAGAVAFGFSLLVSPLSCVLMVEVGVCRVPVLM